MVFEIRTARPEDAVGIARVWAAAMPQLVKTAARDRGPSSARGSSRVVLIARRRLRGGRLRQHLPARPGDEAPRVRISVQVPPDLRRRGIGGALADADLRAKPPRPVPPSLLVVVADDDESKEFATRRGFTIGRRMSHSRRN